MAAKVVFCLDQTPLCFGWYTLWKQVMAAKVFMFGWYLHVFLDHENFGHPTALYLDFTPNYLCLDLFQSLYVWMLLLRHTEIVIFTLTNCDEYSSKTTRGRDMGFSPHGLVLVEESPVLNLKSYDFQNSGYYVIRKTRFPPKL